LVWGAFNSILVDASDATMVEDPSFTTYINCDIDVACGIGNNHTFNELVIAMTTPLLNSNDHNFHGHQRTRSI